MGWGSLVLLAALLGAGFWLYRRAKGGEGGKSMLSATVDTSSPHAMFLAEARQTFESLQAMNNRGDLAGLRGLTMPSLYEDLAQEVRLRKDPSATRVIQLSADLVDDSNTGGVDIRSVRFSGLLQEQGGDPEAIDEVWHFARDNRGSGWKVAGIEQV